MNIENIIDSLMGRKKASELSALENSVAFGLYLNTILPSKNGTRFLSLSFDNFVGQADVVDLLRVAVAASKKRCEPLSHILICGPPGLGKSLLAKTVASEISADYNEVLGSELRTTKDMANVIGFLRGREENKVLFIEEIHNLRGANAEPLYEAIQDFSIKNEDILPFTLIGATNYTGKIAKPLKDRFAYIVHLHRYNIEEICKVLSNKYIDMDPEVVKYISSRAKGIPRVALHYAKIISDAAVYDEKEPSLRHAEFVMKALDINEEGLTRDDMRVLNLLF
jgi:holliday junction DNA helicase RuvB